MYREYDYEFECGVRVNMGGFLNNSQIGSFLAHWKVVFFENFLMEFIVCMYLKVCVWLDTQETLTGGGGGYFIHDDGHRIPRNDVLMV